MLNSILDDVKREFRHGNMITRIIIVNSIIFFLISLGKIIAMGLNGMQITDYSFVKWFCLSSDWVYNFTHPWVFFTHMFTHEGFWHLFWNMIALYWFGRITGDLLGNHRILPFYIIGGLFGGIAYILFSNVVLHDHFGYALGASAAVNAIMVAAATTSPNYLINLILIGEVKLKYLVFVLVFLDMLAVTATPYSGGHYAHLGGALMGWFLVYQLRQGNDLSAPFNQFFNKVTDFWYGIKNRFSQGKPRPKMSAYTNPEAKKYRQSKPNAKSDKEDLSSQEKLDTILDKIKRTGYESLTKEEKEFLFKASKE